MKVNGFTKGIYKIAHLDAIDAGLSNERVVGGLQSTQLHIVS